jgi:hypothetical protein
MSNAKANMPVNRKKNITAENTRLNSLLFSESVVSEQTDMIYGENFCGISMRERSKFILCFALNTYGFVDDGF